MMIIITMIMMMIIMIMMIMLTVIITDLFADTKRPLLRGGLPAAHPIR